MPSVTNAPVVGSEVRDEALPTYSDCGGVYILSEPSEVVSDSEDSYCMEDCEQRFRHVERWVIASIFFSFVGLAVSLVILIAIFTISW